MLIVIGLNQRLGKDRRAAGDFIGASRVLQELKDGPKRRRVGLEVIGGAPAREGAEILSADGQTTLGEFQRETGTPLILCCLWLILCTSQRRGNVGYPISNALHEHRNGIHCFWVS